MKQLILKHGQSILTSEQKKHIIDTGKMPAMIDEQLQMIGEYYIKDGYMRKLRDKNNTANLTVEEAMKSLKDYHNC